MLKCSEFGPKAEVDFIKSPLGWAYGREEMQYYRGSVLTALVAMGVVCVFVLSALLITVMLNNSQQTPSSSGRRIITAIGILRLPSVPLVSVVLLGEMCVSSATALLFYKYSVGVDIAIALGALVPLFVYVGVYVYQTVLSSRYMVMTAVLTNEESALINGGRCSRFIRYICQPTHDLVILEIQDSEGNHDGNKLVRREGWLRRNYYFVAERRWPLFGSVEVLCGTITNMLEGIPLTTTSRLLCIARPACVLLMSIVLLAMLVLMVPNSVPLQQWCSLLIMGGMVVTSAIATANAVSPSGNLELTTGYAGAVTVGASMVLGILEIMILCVAWLPPLRNLLSLRPRGLQSTIITSTIHNNNGSSPTAATSTSKQRRKQRDQRANYVLDFSKIVGDSGDVSDLKQFASTQETNDQQRRKKKARSERERGSSNNFDNDDLYLLDDDDDDDDDLLVPNEQQQEDGADDLDLLLSVGSDGEEMVRKQPPSLVSSVSSSLSLDVTTTLLSPSSGAPQKKKKKKRYISLMGGGDDSSSESLDSLALSFEI
jgi:hypothetical protein